MTYGELKIRCVKAFPGVDLELIEGWIGDVYADILHELPWQRQDVDAVLQTVAPYSAGTVTVVAGSNAVTGIGTAFTAAMSGMQFRVPVSADVDTDEQPGGVDVYTFTWTGPLAGTLDRPFEGTSAAGAGYSLSQSIYTMPANCRLLENNAFSGFTSGPMLRMDRSQLNRSDPSRAQTGLPGIWASFMDDDSTPPNMQVELYPAPDQVYAIPYRYQAEVPALSGTGVTLLPWVHTSALIEGVTARIKAQLKDYTGAQLHAAAAMAAVKRMRGAEAQGMGPAQMQLDRYYTRHRMKRCR